MRHREQAMGGWKLADRCTRSVPGGSRPSLPRPRLCSPRTQGAGRLRFRRGSGGEHPDGHARGVRGFRRRWGACAPPWAKRSPGGARLGGRCCGMRSVRPGLRGRRADMGAAGGRGRVGHHTRTHRITPPEGTAQPLHHATGRDLKSCGRARSGRCSARTGARRWCCVALRLLELLRFVSALPGVGCGPKCVWVTPRSEGSARGWSKMRLSLAVLARSRRFRADSDAFWTRRPERPRIRPRLRGLLDHQAAG